MRPLAARVRRLAHLSGVLGLGAGLAACRVGAPAPTPPSAALARFDPRVDSLLARMTLAEKVGQMTQADQEFLREPEDIERYALGSVLSGGDSDPRAGNTLQDWSAMVAGYHARARRTRLGIPLLYGVDAVHGHNNVLGAVIFPHNIGLGATRDAELVRLIGEVTAEEMRATGIHWTFAPCLCVPRDERWGRTYEGFSESPELVAELGAAEIRGLQGESLGAPGGVLASAKHFLGDGGTALGHRYGRAGAWTRATRASTRRRCGASTWRPTGRRCRRGWAPSCPPTAAGTG